MDTSFEIVLLFLYNNSFFVLVSGFAFYYLIFKRWLRFIEIEPNAPLENESESTDSDTSDTFCSSPGCVRCNLYKTTLLLAKERLQTIKTDNEQILRKVSEGMTVYQEDIPFSTFAQHPSVFFYRVLQSTPIWESDVFHDSKSLETNFDVILQEFQSVFQRNPSGWKRNETSAGSWDIFHLVNQGTLVEQNAQLCPKTMSTITELPSVMTGNVFGNVSFSVIQPSTMISEHYGPTNIRLRCHLGLVCDPTYCLSVSDQSKSWETGKTLVFDDSYLHSVYSSGVGTAGFRAVLIVDIWHPDLTNEEREIIDIAFAPFSD